jgi:DNA repair exonuclease SbcCD ATPase subunit
MRNNESRLKEISDFIKSAKDNVLTEINKRNSKNIFDIFMGGLGKATLLEKSQSLLDKALNEVSQLSDQEMKSLAKLQCTLNDKNSEIRDLEEKLEEFNNKLLDLETSKALPIDTSNREEKPELENKNDSLIAVNTTANEELEEILNIKNANIEQLTQELEHFKTKCSLLEKQVEESSLLTVEFSQRIKRLKTEITAS